MSALIDTSAGGDPVARCPLHVGAERARELAPDDALALPFHRRAIVQYGVDDAGGRVLHLFHGRHAVTFDEPELFAFGESLARQSSFVARDAMGWVEDGSWARVAAPLQALVEAGVLRHAADAPAALRLTDDGGRPSPLPPAASDEPAWWDRCETVVERLAGSPLEAGWLEVVVPIFRVAHVALDADGRQVGEANVFPPALRLDVPTRWRSCIYDGSRHRADRPMNVTALKTMRTHWGAMMRTLLNVRAAFLEREGMAHDAREAWTVGRLERLSVAVLALATYPLVRGERPVANGALHPVLSSLFRVTDGLRMTMHQMLFIPLGEPTRSPDAPMTSAELLAYAERNHAFHSDHGVCAGPPGMIAEFLAVLVDGHRPEGVDDAPLAPAVIDALADVDAAIDYGLLGLRTYAAVFSLWPRMTRAYETLAQDTAAWAVEGSRLGTRLHERFAELVERARARTYLAEESWRQDREAVYADMDTRCATLLGVPTREDLRARLAAATRPDGGAVASLRAILAARDGHLPSASRDRTADGIASFLADTQGILALASDAQAALNRHLGRATPARALTARDLDLHNRLSGERGERLPYLIDEVADLVGCAITIDRDAIVIVANDNDNDAPRTTTAVTPDSAGMGSAG